MNRGDIKIGIADMKIARREGILITHALGSCIGITLYDPMIKLGALLHIMLPEAAGNRDVSVFKFADTGIQETLRKLSVFGGQKKDTYAKSPAARRCLRSTEAESAISDSEISTVSKRL